MGRRKKEELIFRVFPSLEEKEEEILKNPLMGFDEKSFRLGVLKKVGVESYVIWIEPASFLGGRDGRTMGVKTLFHKDTIENRLIRLHKDLSLTVVLLEKKRGKK